MIFEYTDDTLCKCDDCGDVQPMGKIAKSLFEADNLAERLDPGSVVPAGECECGAFTYLLTPQEATAYARVWLVYSVDEDGYWSDKGWTEEADEATAFTDAEQKEHERSHIKFVGARDAQWIQKWVREAGYTDRAAMLEGWALFTCDDGVERIQRLDTPRDAYVLEDISDKDLPEVLESDDVAIALVRKRAAEGSPLHLDAIARHNTKRNA